MAVSKWLTVPQINDFDHDQKYFCCIKHLEQMPHGESINSESLCMLWR